MVQRLTFVFYVDIFVFFTISEIKLCKKGSLRYPDLWCILSYFFCLFFFSYFNYYFLKNWGIDFTLPSGLKRYQKVSSRKLLIKRVHDCFANIAGTEFHVGGIFSNACLERNWMPNSLPSLYLVMRILIKQLISRWELLK